MFNNTVDGVMSSFYKMIDKLENLVEKHSIQEELSKAAVKVAADLAKFHKAEQEKAHRLIENISNLLK